MTDFCSKGGDSLRQTADICVRSVQAVAANVAVAAEAFHSKLTSIEENLAGIESEVAWLGAKVDMGMERRARMEIRKLATKRHREE